MKYKMSDVFELPVYGLVQITTAGNAFSVNGVEIGRQHQAAITHAINNHDRLTAQVEELKAAVSDLLGHIQCDTKSAMNVALKADELLTRIGDKDE